MWRRWTAVLVGIGLLGTAVWLWPRPTRHFTERAPSVAEQPALEQAWRQFRDGDFYGCLDTLATLDADDPAVDLLAAAAHLATEDWEGFSREIDEGLDRDGPRSAVTDLLELLAERDGPGPWWHPAFHNHRDRWPDDRLAVLMQSAGMLHTPLVFDAWTLEQLVERYPDDPAAVVIAADVLASHPGHRDDAVAVAAAGRRRHPDSAAIARVQARIAHDADDPVSALAFAADAGEGGRFYALAAAARLGHELDEGAWSPEEALQIALLLTGLGQPDNPYWDQTVGVEARGRRVVVSLSPWMATPLQLQQAVEGLDAVLVDVDSPWGRRQSAVGHGMLAVRRGDLDAAEAHHEGLRGTDAGDWLADAIAAARGRPKDEPATTCTTNALRGALSVEAGGSAGRIWDRILHDHCDRGARGQALAGRALLGEDVDLASVWPDPDPDLPVMRRLRERVDAP